jgi:NADPH-dependent ferric siderophore reductase
MTSTTTPLPATTDPFRATAIPAMRAALNALDAEIDRQQFTGFDDEEVADLAEAADRLREVLRAAGEAV